MSNQPPKKLKLSAHNSIKGKEISSEQLEKLRAKSNTNKCGCNSAPNSTADTTKHTPTKSGCSCSTNIPRHIAKQQPSTQCSCGCNAPKPTGTAQPTKQRKSIALYVVLGIVGVVLLAVLIAFWVDGTQGINAIADFVSSQLLGMQWLNVLVGQMLTAIGGVQFASSTWGQALQFFIYDTIKIIVLLCTLIFAVSYIQSYFPPERTKRILGKYRGIGANILGALLGTVTPFCSCSSIPIFMGFTRAGLSSGVTFSFLISSPLVDLGAFVLLVSVFGFPVAIAYVVVGLVLAVVGGTVIDKCGMGKHIREFVTDGALLDYDQTQLTVKDRMAYSVKQMLSTLRKVWLFVLIGVAIGASIHNFVPTEWIQAILGEDKWYSVIVASVVGVPMYADIFGTIPVAEALFYKGVGIGTILSFMMSVTALSLPSIIMLSKAVKPKLLGTFVAVVVVGIIAIGYIFNAVSFVFV